jgi:ribosomal protein S18 acetylase RimI-like enzyme
VRTISTVLPLLPEAVKDLSVRRYAGPSDHAALADLWSATLKANGSAERMVTGNVDAWLGHPRNMDPTHDLAVVQSDDGTIAAAAVLEWIDRNTTGERSFECHCDVLPSHRRRGIGTALLAWQETRVAEILGSMTDVADRRVVRAGYVMDADVGARILLERAGFAAVRRSSELHRPDLADLPDVPSPAGIVIGPIDEHDEALVRRVWEVGGEVFAGHWGDPLPDRSEEGWLRFREDPDVEPSLWCVAFDGDEVVGHILNYLGPDDGGSMIGWTEGIAVRDGWRRRGIARAMLAWSLRRLRDAGARTAALGVDMENPNQALTLYESLGFRVTASETEYHLPVRTEARQTADRTS